MKKSKNINEFIVKLFWGTYKKLIDRSQIAAIIFTCVITFMLFLLIEKDKSEIIYGISRTSWMAIITSLLAAAIFLIIQWLVSLFEKVKPLIFQDTWHELVEKYGLKKIYSQRGSSEIVKQYDELIKNARNRIWAFGMTNKHFVEQHKSTITNLIKKKGVDVVIAFWNPKTKMILNENEIKSIIGIQEIIEDNTESINIEGKIKSRQKGFTNEIVNVKIKGRIKIINISSPTNISCFIIDDEVFFFPYLSGPDSTDDPAFHCSASIGIGKRIYEHFINLLTKQELVECVYENDKNKIKINLL